MDTRNRDELLKKQETLEAYLLKNPQSTLFAWYARQNMEAGELNRALSICLLGIQNVESRGILHKLMGEIYLAKGEVTNSMKQMIECILTKEPFPGVIIEVIKNLGDSMEPQQVAFLIYLLNKALPGHPDAVQFYKKFPNSRNYVVQPGEYNFLEDMAIGLERSALLESMPLDEEEENPLALPDAVPAEEEYTPPPQPQTQAAPPQPAHQAPPPVAEAVPEPAPQKAFVEPEPEAKSEPPVPEYEIPDSTPPLEELMKDEAAPTPVDQAPQSTQPEPAPAQQPPTPPPAEATPPTPEPAAAQKPTVKHNINRSMATFTLMQIFKDQGMYENALQVLEFLRDKSSDIERIDVEEKEIRELIARNGGK